MLTAGSALVGDLGGAIARDPDVRQARMIAEAARTRLMACVSRPEDKVDLAEAQGMLDALRNARALAGDAEDRVLLHRGLLTPAEADKRAAKRRPAAAPARPTARRQRLRDLRASRVLLPRVRVAAFRPGGRHAARAIGTALAIALLGAAAGAALARRGGVRLPRTSR